jgi:ABC-type multidrug transport system fused ATPase/permease subunit
MRRFVRPHWRNVIAVIIALILSIGMTVLIAGFQKRPVNLGFGPE